MMRPSARILVLPIGFLLAGCDGVWSQRIGDGAAICAGTESAADDLAQAVVDQMEQTPPPVRIAAAELIVKLEAGCD